MFRFAVEDSTAITGEATLVHRGVRSLAQVGVEEPLSEEEVHWTATEVVAIRTARVAVVLQLRTLAPQLLQFLNHLQIRKRMAQRLEAKAFLHSDRVLSVIIACNKCLYVALDRIQRMESIHMFARSKMRHIILADHVAQWNIRIDLLNRPCKENSQTSLACLLSCSFQGRIRSSCSTPSTPFIQRASAAVKLNIGYLILGFVFMVQYASFNNLPARKSYLQFSKVLCHCHQEKMVQDSYHCWLS